MIKTRGATRRGFFFAVMALAMLSVVLMTVQVWVKTFEQSDYSASQRFKGEAMRSILSTMSDKALSDFANASAFYATYRLANYTSDVSNALAPQDGALDSAKNPGTYLVEKTAMELITNGSSMPNSNNPIEYSPEEKGAYTLAGWENRTESAASEMGFDIQFSNVSGFRYYQIDAWTIGVSFGIQMNVTDAEGTMRQQKELNATASFPINGFLDPMITRDDMAHRGAPRELATEKQVFKVAQYNVPSDVKPQIMDSSGIEGNGWFFGPIVEGYPPELASSSGANVTNLDQFVLVHPYDENLSAYAGSYGAVIVETQPGINTTNGCEQQTECLNCMEKTVGLPGCTDNDPNWHTYPNNNPVGVPVIVASNEWNISKVMDVNRTQDGGTVHTDKYVLIDNAYPNPEDKMKDGYHRIWDITKLRDMAICGFYVQNDVQNTGGTAGPSYFQRMLAGAENIHNPMIGIESFVVGQWAGGAQDTAGNYAADSYSRLDWEFYERLGGNGASKIKGMMGCKTKDMCSTDNATRDGVGHFELSDDAIARYFAGNISCGASGQISPCT